MKTELQIAKSVSFILGCVNNNAEVIYHFGHTVR